MQTSLALVGAGRVGRALGRRLREQGWKIGAVVTRSEASARRAVRFICAGIPCAGMTRQILASHLILIAVPDDAVTEVAQELARISGEELRGKTVLHTSGALDASALKAVKECGAAVGGMHPLQSFSGVGVPPLEGSYLRWRVTRRQCERRVRLPDRLVDLLCALPQERKFCITWRRRWPQGTYLPLRKRRHSCSSHSG